MSFLLDTIEELKEKYKKGRWTGIYKDILDLTPDARGNVGEIMVFEKLLPSFGITDIIFNKDVTTTDDDTYDGIVNGKKIEIKTATIGSGKSKTFQHENFYLDEKGADLYFLIDICEDKYYFSIFSKEELINLKEILGINLHSRHTTGAKKLTISEKNLAVKSVGKGKTMIVTESTDVGILGGFITGCLG